MSGRQQLLRLCLRASRHTAANSGHCTAHLPAPCIDASRACLLNRDGKFSSATMWGSRTLCTPSLFPNSSIILAPGFRNEGNWATKEVGCTTAVLAQIQQRRTLTKLKKTKIKAYSSYKMRFRGMASGEYKRWRSGTRHNAHSKTNKQRRQLRRPSVAPLALAIVMKKLNFMG